MKWYRIRDLQMDNLRGLLGMRRLDKVLNALISELCRVTKRVNETMDEGVLWWFGHMEKMRNHEIARRVRYESEQVVV